MAYVPTIWQTGDIVTAEKLNKLENGLANVDVGGGGLKVNFTYDGSNYIGDTLVEEIIDAFESGKIVLYGIPDGGDLEVGVYHVAGHAGATTFVLMRSGAVAFTGGSGYPKFLGK